MKKETIYKYIIYKIFTSKYKDLFVLDGSYGLYLTVNSKNKRKLGDLDLDILIKETEVNWDNALKVVKGIFNDESNVEIYITRENLKTRRLSKTTFGSKMHVSIGDESVELDFSILLDDGGITITNWRVRNEEFIGQYGIEVNENIEINIFEPERYFANKLLAIIKVTENFKQLDNNLSKSLYDIWYIIKEMGDLDQNKIQSLINVMSNNTLYLYEVYKKLEQFLSEYWDNGKYKLENYIQSKSMNKKISWYDVYIGINSYIKSVRMELNNDEQ